MSIHKVIFQCHHGNITILYDLVDPFNGRIMVLGVSSIDSKGLEQMNNSQPLVAGAFKITLKAVSDLAEISGIPFLRPGSETASGKLVLCRRIEQSGTLRQLSL